MTIVASGPEDLAVRLLGEGQVVGLLQHLGIGSVTLVPLVVGGRTQAVLSLVATDRERFTSAYALVIEDLTRRIGLTIDRIQLHSEAQDANRLKDEFLSTLSHELRTPLNAIFGWARMLRMRNLDKAAAHAVAVIERNAEAQVRLIEDVLDVSRIITGKMRLTMEPVELGAVLRTTIDALLPTIQAKRIRFVESVEANLPAVFADAHRLQQVFWNLLSNALKFTSADGAIESVSRPSRMPSSSPSSTLESASAATCSRSCSTDSGRAIRPRRERMAVLDSASLLSGTSLNCMAGALPLRVPATGAVPHSPSNSPSRTAGQSQLSVRRMRR